MSGGSDNGHVLGGATATIAGAAGVTVLPDTSGSVILQIISIAAIVFGGAVLATSLARLVAKRVYKA